MKTTVKYKASGIVLGNYWGGGKGGYKAERVFADTKEELIDKINEGIKDGSLDSGMGYESLIGAIMDITTITTIIYQGKKFKNEETDIEVFGSMTSEETQFLEDTFYSE